MDKSVIKVGPHSIAITFALILAISSLFMLIPMWGFSSFIATGRQGSGFPSIAFFLMPVFHFIFGYVFMLISAVIFNVTSRFTGGIKFVVSTDSAAE